MDKRWTPGRTIAYCGVLGYCHRYGKCARINCDHLGEQMTLPTIQIHKGARVYIVEDNQERLNWFFSRMPSATIWTEMDPKLVAEQLSWLLPETMDCIFLDLDLRTGPRKEFDDQRHSGCRFPKRQTHVSAAATQCRDPQSE